MPSLSERHSLINPVFGLTSHLPTQPSSSAQKQCKYWPHFRPDLFTSSARLLWSRPVFAPKLLAGVVGLNAKSFERTTTRCRTVVPRNSTSDNTESGQGGAHVAKTATPSTPKTHKNAVRFVLELALFALRRLWLNGV